MSSMAFIPWVRSWLQVSGLVSSRLFPLCAGEEENLPVLSSCLPRGSTSSLGLCSGPALHFPVGDVVISFYCFLFSLF